LHLTFELDYKIPHIASDYIVPMLWPISYKKSIILEMYSRLSIMYCHLLNYLVNSNKQFYF